MKKPGKSLPIHLCGLLTALFCMCLYDSFLRVAQCMQLDAGMCSSCAADMTSKEALVSRALRLL